jgi:hypothetical protein
MIHIGASPAGPAGDGNEVGEVGEANHGNQGSQQTLIEIWIVAESASAGLPLWIEDY